MLSKLTDLYHALRIVTLCVNLDLYHLFSPFVVLKNVQLCKYEIVSTLYLISGPKVVYLGVFLTVWLKINLLCKSIRRPLKTVSLTILSLFKLAKNVHLMWFSIQNIICGKNINCNFEPFYFLINCVNKVHGF